MNTVMFRHMNLGLMRKIGKINYYGEKSLKEIATAMGMSFPNMKILHKKALNQLKKKFL